ncbi:MAG TPA: dihydroorotase [Gammaproteobacteria bacterium]|nr:dihydroorotase [Gammaproteobacteria bacterium]
METITLIRPDDWHLHLRDGEQMAAVLPCSARQFARALIMPNLRPPVTTTEQALAYRERILAALPEDADFDPLMTLYLTDNTSPDEIVRAKESGKVLAVKLYPAGATTNSDAGVTDIAKTQAVLEKMAELGMPLCVHGEVTRDAVDVFDREAVFIDEVLAPLAERLPELKIVFEHITTARAVEFVRWSGPNIAATITPQHLLHNRNAIFKGGIRPHYYCLPVLKTEPDRTALLEAATSGNPKFFLGTDSAPHARHAKEASCGCAGCFSAHAALELYAEAFDAMNALDRLEGFASRHGAEFYGLPCNTGTVTLRREAWTPPPVMPFAADEIVPFRADETIFWRQA